MGCDFVLQMNSFVLGSNLRFEDLFNNIPIYGVLTVTQIDLQTQYVICHLQLQEVEFTILKIFFNQYTNKFG